MLTLIGQSLPTRLTTIASPPKQLYVDGPLEELLQRPAVAIVGSRKVSAYGREVTRQLAGDLAKQGIVIISGLAFGVDSIAHQAALDAGGLTIAVLSTPLDRVSPVGHRQLAKDIITSGGALVSEYASGAAVFAANFIARDRLIAGLADATLITEAALKSGSLHTARFALNAGKDVLAVPGNINSPTSEGTNNLLKVAAAVITSVDDVLHALKLEPTSTLNHRVKGSTPDEQTILDLIANGMTDGTELQLASGLEAIAFNQTLTMLEITGKIRSLGANHWSL